MTGDARVWFPISSGLLTWKHYQRLGPAWLVFMWMIHEQRAPKDGEANSGAVRNGEPISYEDIGACLHGMPARTVERHIALLEREGYIRSEYIHGHGKRYIVANPIRWSMVLPRNGELDGDSAELRSAYSPEMGSCTPQICGAVLPINGEGNKEQKPKTKNKIKTNTAPDGAVVLDPLPDWIPLENWQGFVEHRRKIRKPLSPRAIKLTIKDLAQLRERGQLPAAVLDQSVKNGWTGIFELKGGSTNGNGKTEHG